MADKEKKVAEVNSKPVKPAKEKKNGRLKEAWRGFKSEVKKVVWPSWKQVLKNTGIVLVVVLICALMIGALDFAFRTGFDALTQLFA
ncbi:MAG: preprotein translocase subunit SecE [Clostridia bacterium]|nr:preprotein translocase subunit SecE [Clostridia bacterium]